MTNEELLEKINNKTITEEEIGAELEKCKLWLDKNTNYKETCLKLQIISTAMIINSMSNLVQEAIDISNNYLLKKIDKEDYENLCLALLRFYYILGFAPKVIEYGLKFENLITAETKNISVVYNLMSVVLNENGFYEKALEYYEKIFAMHKNSGLINEDFFEIVILNNKCHIYIKLKKFKEAHNFYQQMLILYDKYKDYPEYKQFLISNNTTFTGMYLKFKDPETKDIDDLCKKFIVAMKEKDSTTTSRVVRSETFLPYLEVFEVLYQNTYYQDAINFTHYIIDNPSYSGPRAELYEFLLKCYEKIAVTKEEKNDAFKEYVKFIVLDKQKYNDILKKLILEQFRIQSIENKYQEIKKSYEIDYLTKCRNRPSLEIHGQEYIHNNQNGSLVFIDLDGLKGINDSLGHSFGDLYLEEFANCVRKVILGKYDFYRYAGDEFIIMTNVNLDETKLLLQAILETLDEEVGIDNVFKKIEFSSGIVEFKNNGNLAEIIKKADVLMYDCKKQKYKSSLKYENFF